MARGGQLKIRVVGDSSDLQQKLGKASSKIGSFAKKAAKVGAAGAAALGAAAVTGAAKVASFGDEIAKSSQKAGLGVEQFQELRFAFKQGGVETGTFDTAVQKFNKRLGESATTGGTADEAFKSLGISLRDSEGNVREAGGAMEEVLPKLAQIESNSERAAVAGDLFGQRAGPELAAALSDGAGGIEKARQKAQDLGIVMGEDAAKKAEQFTDSFDDIKQSTLGLLRTGLTPLMGWLADDAFPFIQDKIIPALRDFRDWIGPKLTSAAKKIGKFITGTVVPAFRGIVNVVTPLITILKDGLTPGLGDAHGAFKKLPASLHGFAQTIFDIGSTVRQTVGIIGSFVTILKDGLTPGIGNAHEAFKNVPKSLHGVGQAVFDVGSTIRQALTKISGWWSDNGPMIISTAKAIGKAIVNFARTAGQWIATLAGVVDAAMSTVIGWFESSGSQASETSARMQSVFDQLLATTKTIWNAISTVIGTTIKVVAAVVIATVAVIQAVWERWGSDIKQFAETAFNAILNIIDGVLQTISGVFDVFAGLFTGDWERVWKGVKDIFAGLLNIIQGLWEMALGAVEFALQVFRDVMSSIWSRLWTWAKDFVSDRIDDVVGFVKGLPGRARSGLSSAWSAYQEFWQDKFQTAADFVSDRIDDVIGFFRDLPDNIVDALGDLGLLLIQAGKDLLGGLAEGVKSAVGTLGDALSSAVTSAADAIPFVDAKGDGPGFGVPGIPGGGAAMDRAQAAMQGLPVSVTSTYRTPAENARVGGSPTSYHMDKSNPAVDIGGPTWALDIVAARLREMNANRELLWRVPKHFDHVHVAHKGGEVTPRGIQPIRQDELLTRLKSGETVRTRQQESELRSGGDTIHIHLESRGNVRDDAQAAKLALMR